MMTSMLKTVLTYGTGTEAAISGVYQAGKTGTSNYSDDELEEIEESTGIYNSVVGTMAPDELFFRWLHHTILNGSLDRL